MKCLHPIDWFFQHIWSPEVVKKVFLTFIKAYTDLSLWIEHPNCNAIIPSTEGKPWNTWKHIHSLCRTENWHFQGHLTWGQASIKDADVPSFSGSFFQLPLQIMQRTGNTDQRLRSSNISLCLNIEWLFEHSDTTESTLEHITYKHASLHTYLIAFI